MERVVEQWASRLIHTFVQSRTYVLGYDTIIFLGPILRNGPFQVSTQLNYLKNTKLFEIPEQNENHHYYDNIQICLLLLHSQPFTPWVCDLYRPIFFRDSFLATLAHLANMLLVLIHTINRQLCRFNGRPPSMKIYSYYLQFSLT